MFKNFISEREIVSRSSDGKIEKQRNEEKLLLFVFKSMVEKEFKKLVLLVASFGQLCLQQGLYSTFY